MELRPVKERHEHCISTDRNTQSMTERGGGRVGRDLSMTERGGGRVGRDLFSLSLGYCDTHPLLLLLCP